MPTRFAWLCAILFVFAVRPVHAQVITSAEIERGLRYPRGSTPYDGEPFMQRYNYYPGAILYLNGNAAELRYLDYLDRADRAQKFGYRMPADPFENPVPQVQPAVRFGIGGGYGIFRRR